MTVTVVTEDDGGSAEVEVTEVVAETAAEVAEVVAEAIAGETETAEVAETAIADHETTVRLIVRDELKNLGLEERLTFLAERIGAQEVDTAVAEEAVAEAEVAIAEAETIEAVEELAEEAEEDEIASDHWLYRRRSLFGRR